MNVLRRFANKFALFFFPALAAAVAFLFGGGHDQKMYSHRAWLDIPSPPTTYADAPEQGGYPPPAQIDQGG